MAETLRVGLIGCGNNMRAHIKRLADTGAVEVVGIAEPFAENVEKAREQFPLAAQAPLFGDHGTLLQSVSPDAVVISTPHHLHCEQILDSLEAGCHVLCEKPMTCTSDEARAVCAKTAETGKVMMVSYQRHQMPLFRFMRRFLAEGGVGRLQTLCAQQYQSWEDIMRQRGNPWRVQADKSGGGQLNDSGSHMVDILLHITNLQPRRVSALMQHFDFEVDVASTVNVAFDGGVMGSIGIYGNARGLGGSVLEDITLIGTETALYYRVVGQPGNKAKLELRRAGETSPAEFSPELPPGSNPDQAFVDVIHGRAENEAPPECGLKTIQLSEAAWESARHGGAPTEVKV